MPLLARDNHLAFRHNAIQTSPSVRPSILFFRSISPRFLILRGGVLSGQKISSSVDTLGIPQTFHRSFLVPETLLVSLLGAAQSLWLFVTFFLCEKGSTFFDSISPHSDFTGNQSSLVEQIHSLRLLCHKVMMTFNTPFKILPLKVSLLRLCALCRKGDGCSQSPYNSVAFSRHLTSFLPTTPPPLLVHSSLFCPEELFFLPGPFRPKIYLLRRGPPLFFSPSFCPLSQRGLFSMEEGSCIRTTRFYFFFFLISVSLPENFPSCLSICKNSLHRTFRSFW